MFGSNAGVAQLVERNLAKVEVESSRLFSRSRILKGKHGFPFLMQRPVGLQRKTSTSGEVAKRLCSGLQSRLDGFDSRPRLQNNKNSPLFSGLFFLSGFLRPRACVAKKGRLPGRGTVAPAGVRRRSVEEDQTGHCNRLAGRLVAWPGMCRDVLAQDSDHVLSQAHPDRLIREWFPLFI